jgi:molybdopterin-guanine dinucleotide biosynthesis protein A
VVGAILAGGDSRRMGRDKALVPVEGAPMAARVAEALRACGAEPVVLVGARQEVCERLGIVSLADRWPGAGPLGGIATALLDAPLGVLGSHATHDRVVVVASCDQPDLTGEALARLVRALLAAGPETVAAATVTPDGRRHPFPAAWRRDAGPRLAEALAQGERRADAAWAAGAVVEVAVGAAEIADLDTPEQVAARRGSGP